MNVKPNHTIARYRYIIIAYSCRYLLHRISADLISIYFSLSILDLSLLHFFESNTKLKETKEHTERYKTMSVYAAFP